jgi:hypothetical protein
MNQLTPVVGLINDQLAQIVSGESSPSFQDEQFLDIVGAIAWINTTNDEKLKQSALASIGLHTMLLVLERLHASMGAERTLAIMRSDKPQDLN